MAKDIYLALRPKKKLEFIDGTIPNLQEDAEKEEERWEINTLFNSWILNTIEPSLRSSMNYLERANELWADLKERLLVGNGPRKYELKATLANCKEGRDFENAYYSHLKKIRDGLENYIQLSSTTNVEFLSAITKERDKERIFQFLMGLNDKLLGTAKSNIIQQEPVSKVKTVLANIYKEEQHKNVAWSSMGEDRGGAGVVFAFGKTLQQSAPSRWMCLHCHKTAQDIEKFF